MTVRDVLLQIHDADTREYADDTDQIREVLIHANYLSQKDVEVCLGFDMNTLAAEAEFPAIKALFDAFVVLYQAEDA
ncbi:MAG: hypothetical protein HZC43_01505 [Nitrosomonadales bacterium]|nr:hypothetical protein [Nitrosomonadales bacterium]